MAEYSPPIENLPIFDKLVFLSGDEYITQNQADKRYLRYPNAQGTENLQAINVGGTSNFNEEANFNDVLKSKLQLQVIDSTASGAITESVVLANVATGNRIVYILNPNNNAYNKLTQPNDNLMVYGDVIDSVGALTIAPWSSTCNGLRMTQDTVMLGSGGTADNPTHRINTDTTQLLLTSSNLKVDGNITSINASAANRQVTASYYNVTDITANLTGTQIYQNVQTCFLDNNAATNGGFTFACNNSSGSQQTPFSVFATTVQSNKNFLINGLGNYLQFPDGTQQFTAAVTSTNKTYTTRYTTSTSITLPVGTVGISVRCIGCGGNAGAPDDGNGGSWGAGGSGGGGVTVFNQGTIPFIEGTVLQINITSTYTEITNTTLGASVCRANCGGNGGNASASTGGTFGVGGSTWTVNSAYCDWSGKSGSNGTVGASNIGFDQPLYPTTAGTTPCVPFSDTQYGCGQRWNGPQGSLNSYQGAAIPKPSGVCYITYYLI